MRLEKPGPRAGTRDRIEADLVIPVPDSAIPAAIATRRRRACLRDGLVRSPYVGRTFIEPEQSIRHFGVR
jgi:amidophosphoribosyltransferase